MANVEGTFYSATTQRRGVTPVSPPNAVDDPVSPVNPPIGSHPPVTIGTPANGLSIVPSSQELSLGLASAGVTGALSGTDWSTFNGKLSLTSPITGYTVGANTALAATDSILQAFGKVQGQINARVSGTIAAGQVAFGTGANTIGGDSGLAWDNVSKRLYIGGSGASKLVISDGISSSIPVSIANEIWVESNNNTGITISSPDIFGSRLYFGSPSDSSGALLEYTYNSGNPLMSLGTVTANGAFRFLSSTGIERARFLSTGEFGIATNAPTNTLDVNGTARIRTLSNATGNFVTTSATGVLQQRTPTEARTDLGLGTAITGTGVAGQVAFFNGTGSVAGDTIFQWDNSLKSLKLIGTSGSYLLDLQNTNGGALARFKDSDSTYLGLLITGDTNGAWVGNNNPLVGEGIYYQNNINALRIYTNSIERWRIINTGILQSSGAQTIQTSTGNLTLATAAGNGSILINPNGTGGIVLSKNVAIGAAIDGVTNLYISKNIEGGASSFGLYSDSIIQSSVTGVANYFRTLSRTVATAFTLPILAHYSANQGTFGAGSTVNTQYGFEVGSTLIGATTNIGYYGNIPSGTNRWNIFMNGTALNYFNGNVLIGTTTDSGDKLRVNGTVRIDSVTNAVGNVMTISATGVLQQRTISEIATDGGFVTLTGAQTITGAKTFNASTLFGDVALDYMSWDNSTKIFGIFSQAQYLHKYRGGAAGALNMGQYDVNGNASINNTSNAKLIFGTNNTTRLEIEANGDIIIPSVPSGTGESLMVEAGGRIVKGSAGGTLSTGTSLTLIDSTGGATYTLSSGSYKLLETSTYFKLSFSLSISSSSGTPSGKLRITGLPTMTGATSGFQQGNIMSWIDGNVYTNKPELRPQWNQSSNYIEFIRIQLNVTENALLIASGVISGYVYLYK